MTAYPTPDVVHNLLAAAGWTLDDTNIGTFLTSPEGVMYAVPTVEHTPTHVMAWKNFINFQTNFGQK